MSVGNLISVGAAATADLLSALNMPGGNAMQKLVDLHLEQRRSAARDALLNELRNGYHGFIELGREDLDPLIGILMRFWRAAEEGLARDNLRLLAQIIAGLKKHRRLEYAGFTKWAAVLEELTPDQLLIVGAAYVRDRDHPTANDGNDESFWSPFCTEMEARGFDRIELELHCAAIAKHGLFRAASGWEAIVYDSTPWLRELGVLADLDGLAHGVGGR